MSKWDSIVSLLTPCCRVRRGGDRGRLLEQQALLLESKLNALFGGFALGGIGTATFGAVLLAALLLRRREQTASAAVARP